MSLVDFMFMDTKLRGFGIPLPMKHKWEVKEDGLHVEYLWKTKKWNKFAIKPIQ